MSLNEMLHKHKFNGNQMNNQEITKKRQIFEEYLQLLSNGEFDKLVEELFTEDAVLAGPNATFIGHEELKKHFYEDIQALGNYEIIEVSYFSETQDTIFSERLTRSNLGLIRGCNAFVMRNNKIAYLFVYFYPVPEN